ncbi:xanthine/uracil permease [Anaeramoeba flamelloides]|uniref:Xanthine/uracil permease n=1 Tax=Anaeramoeba flamelloides TaxID=1746091 RepID=A0ABQ8YI96_9EUKA|nr:xanthine/uracil permease [Anaeramoeba flamelloides]
MLDSSSSSDTNLFLLAKNEEQEEYQAKTASNSLYKSRCVAYVDQIFHISERGSNFKTETIAGIAMFFTSLYILKIQPYVLNGVGIPERSAFSSTALITGLATITTGYITTIPILLSTGMGENYFFSDRLVKHFNYHWRDASSLIVVEGLIFSILALIIFRKRISKALPPGFRIGVSFGIALFLGMVGMSTLLQSQGKGKSKNSNDSSNDDYEQNIDTIDVVISYPFILATVTLVAIVSMSARNLKSGFIVPSIICTIISIIIRLATRSLVYEGWALPRFGEIFFKLRFKWHLSAIYLLPSLIIDHMFDSLCTLLTIIHFAFLDNVSFDEEAFIALISGPRTKTLRFSMVLTGFWSAVSGLFCNSQICPFIESIVGSAAGAKTGFASVVTGLCFIISLFIYPITSLIPEEATTPLMIFTTAVVFSLSNYIDFNNLVVTIPIIVSTICIPLTQSVLIGTLLSYVFLVLCWLIGDNKKYKEISPSMIVLFILTLFSLIFYLFT